MRRILLAAFTYSISLAVWAQSPLGTVTGLATDPSGAVIPDVKVTLISTATGVKREVATNTSGVYVIPNIQPGQYKIFAEAKGFKALETTAFPVEAYRTVRQDLKLEVAAATTEVTVSEPASAVIQVESPSINASLSTKQILELPSNLRSVYNNAGDSGLLAIIAPLTLPGVIQVGAGATWTSPGGTGNAFKTKVDGIDTTFGNFGSPDVVSQPSMESLQEFTANILTNRAEFSGMAVITSVTRGGGNQYHGNIFWYARNTALDARNTFATTKPFQNIHNFGGTFSGPVFKDKTFFMLTLDMIKGVRGYSGAPNVPTVAWRNGDFTGLPPLRNPFGDINPFNGNVILPQYISPQAKKIQELLFPLPNFGPPTLTTGNYRWSASGAEIHGIGEVRLDHNFTSGHSVFGRYQSKVTDYNIPGVRTDMPPSSVGTSNNVRTVNFGTVGDTYAIRPNVYNEFRAGIVVLSSKSTSNIKGQDLIDAIGIRGLSPRPGINGVPNINITGLSTIRQLLLNPVNDGHWQFSDNLTWTRGKHSMKYGVELVHYFVNRYMPVESAVFGNFSFTNRFTGHPYADFLLGLPTSVTRLDPYPAQITRWSDVAFYGQDDFKVTPRLTLSYGLRYEYNQPPTLRDDNIYSFDLASGSIVVPSAKARSLFREGFPANLPVITADKIGLGRSLRNADKNNLAPRFGFSYQLGSDAKTVIRGGWGIYYGHFSGAVTAAVAAGPYSLSTVANNSIVNGRPLYTIQDPFTAPGAGGSLLLNSFTPNLRNGYVQQYSLSVEREVVRDLGVRISYIGSRGSQLPYFRNVNQPPASTIPFAQSRRPYPLFNNINYSENGANSLYSGLQVQAQRRFSKGFLFSSAWTWAKSLSEVDDTANIELGSAIEDAYNRRRDRGDTYAVPRRQWMNQFIYELPFKGMLAGGWQLNALVNFSTGHWLNPQFSGSDPSNTNTIGGRPDIVATSISYPKTLTAWFDRTNFAVPPANAGRFGTAARNSVQGPGYVIFNLGVAKNVKLEKAGLVQIGASFANILNHVNYGQPNMTVNNAAGGAITSTHVFVPAGASRNGMLSLRWSF